jgi:hypothetical protein
MTNLNPTSAPSKTIKHSDVRYHHKQDGILRIADDGSCRFLPLWERIRFVFGARP